MASTFRGSRPSVDEYFLDMATLVARRSTCIRRSVGCVLVNRQNHVLATGYNGVHRGAYHCNAVTGRILFGDEPISDQPYAPVYGNACQGHNLPSGQGLHLCKAIHAEANALVQCRDIDAICTVYCTASPCVQCMRLLAGTSVERIVFLERYPHDESEQIAFNRGIRWIHFGADRGSLEELSVSGPGPDAKRDP